MASHVDGTPRRRTSFRGDMGQMALSQELLQRPGHVRLAFGERLTTIRIPGVIGWRSLRVWEENPGEGADRGRARGVASGETTPGGIPEMAGQLFSRRVLSALLNHDGSGIGEQGARTCN